MVRIEPEQRKDHMTVIVDDAAFFSKHGLIEGIEERLGDQNAKKGGLNGFTSAKPLIQVVVCEFHKDITVIGHFVLFFFEKSYMDDEIGESATEEHIEQRGWSKRAPHIPVPFVLVKEQLHDG